MGGDQAEVVGLGGVLLTGQAEARREVDGGEKEEDEDRGGEAGGEEHRNQAQRRDSGEDPVEGLGAHAVHELARKHAHGHGSKAARQGEDHHVVVPGGVDGPGIDDQEGADGSRDEGNDREYDEIVAYRLGLGGLPDGREKGGGPGRPILLRLGQPEEEQRAEESADDPSPKEEGVMVKGGASAQDQGHDQVGGDAHQGVDDLQVRKEGASVPVPAQLGQHGIVAYQPDAPEDVEASGGKDQEEEGRIRLSPGGQKRGREGRYHQCRADHPAPAEDVDDADPAKRERGPAA